MENGTENEVIVSDDPTALSHAVAEAVIEQAQQAVLQRGLFTLVLAGGGTPLPAYRLLAASPGMPWDKTYVFWGDERFVPPNHPDSNYRASREALLVRVAPAQVFPIPTDGSPETAAEAYEGTLRTFFAEHSSTAAAFDLVLLGMGGDGHTASLFPEGDFSGGKSSRWVQAVEGPAYRPPRLRITLTLAAMNRARSVFFLVAGVDKQPALRTILDRHEGADALPAAHLQPRERLVWFTDRAAMGGKESG